MLAAVNIGRSQPSRLNLLRRRSMRRLRRFNCRRILTFTRNPSRALGNDKLATYQTPQNAGDFEGFRFFLVNSEKSTLVQGLAWRSCLPSASVIVNECS